MNTLVRFLVVACIGFVAGGCGGQTKKTAVSRIYRPPITEADRRLALNFLCTVYRSGESNYRVIIDPNAEEALRHIPLYQRRAELSTRLAALRAAPKDVLRIAISSGASCLEGDFHRSNGRFDNLQFQTHGSKPDVEIELIHWPGGTRLVRIRRSWNGDTKSDYFHLYKNERIYRFAISSWPVD